MRKRIIAATLFILAALLLFAGLRLYKLAFIGSAYAAQQTCACLFISRRPLDSCRGDLDPLAQRIVTIAPSATSVHARAILSSATSTFDPTFGCTLDN